MNQKKSTISAIIISKNESERIGGCIEALSFCDEILVFDNQSSDETVSKAKSQGARVFSLETTDFARMRNIAKSKAKGDWLLYIDADELISDELRLSIQAVTQKDNGLPKQSYEIYRKNYYLGEPWPSGEWKLRLFEKNALEFWSGKIHESPNVRGSIGKLQGYLVHNTHRTLEEMVTKTNEWSNIEANLRFQVGHPSVSWWRILRVIMTGFWDSFVRQGGWRAGNIGWIESIYQGFSLFITYAKLWEMQQYQTMKK